MAWQDRVQSVVRRVPAWPIYGVAAAWAVWRFQLAVTGALGPDPVDALTNETGLLALQLLIAGLVITPLRRYAGVNLLKYRRAIGLVAFFFVAYHFTVWLALDLAFRWDQIWSDLSKRPFIILGFSAFVILIPLAITSNSASIRRLGKRWQVLHRGAYVAVILAALHFLIGVKVVTVEQAGYLAAAVLLVGLRLWWRRGRAVARA